MGRPARTTALVIAAAAFVAIAVGTGATAAVLITSSTQIKDGVVTGADLKNGTVKSPDVGDGTLTGTDIKNGSITNADIAGGYYTRAQVDAKIPTAGELNIPAAAFRPLGAGSLGLRQTGCVSNSSGDGELEAPVVLPVGATITQMRGRIVDDSASTGAELEIFSDIRRLAAFGTDWDDPTPLIKTSSPFASAELVEVGDNIRISWRPGDVTDDLQLCGATVLYTLP